MLAALGILAAISGAAGYYAANRGWVWLVEPMDSIVPSDRHVAFLADLRAHLASYAGGFAGGIVLCVWVVLRRRARSK
jgi:hypothetical protein